MKRLQWITSALLLFGSVSGFDAWAQAAARVNGSVIDREDVLFLAKTVLDFKEDPLSEAKYKESLSKAITNRLVYQEAEAKYPDIAEEVGRMVDLRLAREYVDPYYKKYCLPRAQAAVTLDLLLGKVGPKEDLVNVYQIVLEDKTTADALMVRLRNGEIRFEEAARQYSKGLTASQGGNVGGVARSSTLYDPPVVDILFQTPVGTLTAVVDTQLGPSIFWVKEKKTAEELARQAAEDLRPQEVSVKARELLYRDALEASDEYKGNILLTEKNVERDTPKLDQAAIEFDGRRFTVEDVLSRSGGLNHGWKDILTITENCYRDLVIAARFMKTDGVLPDVERKRKVLVEHYAARKMINRVTQGIQVTDAEVTTYVTGHEGEYRTVDAVDIGLIRVQSDARLRQVQERLSSGKTFEDVAKAWSQHSTAGNSGRLGFLAVSALTPDFRKATAGMKPGEVSQPFQVKEGAQQGYYLVKVYNFQSARALRNDELNLDVVRMKVLAGKRESALGDLINRLYGQASVEVL
ncbi:MAG: peptidylprolyl isomerase [Deltaproteobacteria bacterium]|nr:peptidylprolyl isomerase [Deltaproteobacteria bacterium]